MKSVRKGVSLQWLIGGAMFSSMLLLSALLVFQSYQSSKNALLIATTESARQLGETLNEKATRLTGPAQSALKILSYDPLLQASTLEQRQQRLPVLFETLQSNEVLSAIYVGYTDGAFFLLRKLSNPTLRNSLNPPSGSQYLLQSLTQTPEGTEQRWFYYDKNQRLLQQELKEKSKYDPRTRPWYKLASESKKQILTSPYLFYTTREIGITLAQQGRNSANVIGMDAAVDDLAAQVSELQLTKGSQLAIIDDKQQVLAHTDPSQIIIKEDKHYRLSRLHELKSPVLSLAAEAPADGENLLHRFNAHDQNWYGLSLPLTGLSDHNIQILLAMPADELLAGAKEVILSQSIWTLAVTLMVLGLGLYGGSRIGSAFRKLTGQVRALSGFDFSSKIGVSSNIREAKELSQVVSNMSRTIGSFQAISLCLNRESDLEKMLDGVLEHLVTAAGMNSGAIYLYQSDDQGFNLASKTFPEGYPQRLAEHGQDDSSLLHNTLAQLDEPEKALVISLRRRDNSLEGLLVMRWNKMPRNKTHLVRFVSELAGSAAVAIETRRLIDGQKELIDGILRLLADAIDAKSPYTSGHCERVPQLAFQLIDTLTKQKSGAYANFRLGERDKEAFRIAAWLHDCGKILSPEHIIDKATRLETIFNRIHEVRTRFEVLWRDAEIEYWQKLAAGEQETSLKAALDQRQQELQEQFRFIAKANEGAEATPAESAARIHMIGDQEWVRHFDNTLGLSHEELARLKPENQPKLPVIEKLLSDKPEHIIPWDEGRRPPVEADNPENIWGFDMPLPEYSLNQGERHNLTQPFGTLTPEERFKINEHTVHTIMMLNALPLPDYLKGVPRIAGNHHERMDGQGYPRKLKADQMDTQEKVMAVADIFEALTASDRPYKKPKTVSESLSIMVKMSLNGHIDPLLMTTLLQEQSFSLYAESFLTDEQNDVVDYNALIEQLNPLELEEA